MVALLANCGGDAKPVGTVGYVKGFGGMVAADEPRAVLIARDILSAGGGAADAAVAAYFTMAVTQPSTASLGGGGVCVVHDREKKRTEVVEFLAPPSDATGQSTVPNAVPANVRGFYALHAKYGKLRWEQLLSEPERLARAGVPVSRALAFDLARAGQVLAGDPAARAVFLPGGRPLAEGERLEQRDLAATLARLRRSPGDFYGGAGAKDLVESVVRSGGSLSLTDLRDTKPTFVAPLSVRVGDDTAFFPPPPSVAGAMAAQMTAALVDRWSGATPDDRPHLLAEASAQSFADRARWMMPHGWSNGQGGDLVARGQAMGKTINPQRHQSVDAPKSADSVSAASIVVMDSYGSAVACNVTTYGLFGNGRMAGSTGILLAAVPGLSAGPAAIGPVIIANAHVGEAHFAAAASGGVTAAEALTQVLLDNQLAGVRLDKAVAAPRVHHSGNPDIAFVEEGGNSAGLSKRGHEVKSTAMPSRVNALACASGAPGFDRCRVDNDPRGFGLSAMVGRD